MPALMVVMMLQTTTTVTSSRSLVVKRSSLPLIQREASNEFSEFRFRCPVSEALHAPGSTLCASAVLEGSCSFGGYVMLLVLETRASSISCW